MGAAFERTGIEPGGRQHAGGRRDMAGLAAMRRAGKRQFLLAQAVAVRGAGFDQRQRLQRLDGRARKDRPLDVAERQHGSPVGIDDRDGAAVAAFDQPRRARLQPEQDYSFVKLPRVHIRLAILP